MTQHVTTKRPAGTEALPGAATGKISRFTHGSYEVTVISDGHLTLPTSLIAPEVPPHERSAALEAAALGATSYEPAANIALIRSGSDLILFDTGGAGFQPNVGRISDSLALADVDASDVTKVVFTHGHPDHIGGTLLSDGSLRFPRAHYYAGASEWDFWNGDDVWSRLPREQHPSPSELVGPTRRSRTG